jgi:hypothetical protein
MCDVCWNIVIHVLTYLHTHNTHTYIHIPHTNTHTHTHIYSYIYTHNTHTHTHTHTHSQILKLEQSVNEIFELFKDLSQLVDLQQESLDVIQHKVQSSKRHAQKG